MNKERFVGCWRIERQEARDTGSPWILAIAIALCLGSAAAAGPDNKKVGHAAEAQPPVEATDGPYRIAVDDELNVDLLEGSVPSRTVIVLSDGRISYPFAGQVKVAGLTIAEAEVRLRDALAQAIKRPRVSISVRKAHPQFHQATVMGAVVTPGKRDLKPGTRVFDVLADSGGVTVKRLDFAEANLYRASGGEIVRLDLARLYDTLSPESNPVVHDGDVIQIREKEGNVRVIGEVSRQGAVALTPDSDAASVVIEAAPTEKAGLASVVVLRGSERYTVDLAKIKEGKKPAAPFPLQAGDTVVVPESRNVVILWGAVRNPGKAFLPENEEFTVSGALARLGGVSENADLKQVYVYRFDRGGHNVVKVDLEQMFKKGDRSQDVAVHPGDVLYVGVKGVRRSFGVSDALSIISTAASVSALSRR